MRYCSTPPGANPNHYDPDGTVRARRQPVCPNTAGEEEEEETAAPGHVGKSRWCVTPTLALSCFSICSGGDAVVLVLPVLCVAFCLIECFPYYTYRTSRRMTVGNFRIFFNFHEKNLPAPEREGFPKWGYAGVIRSTPRRRQVWTRIPARLVLIYCHAAIQPAMAAKPPTITISQLLATPIRRSMPAIMMATLLMP